MFVSLASMTSKAAQANPVFEIVQKEPVLRTFMEVSLYLGFAVSIVLIISGIGLLNVKSWARMLSIGYSIYALVMGIVGGVVNYVYLVQPLLERAGEDSVVAKAAAMGGLIGIGAGLIYPILLLIFMLNATVAAAFRPKAAPADPAGPQVVG